MILRTGIAMLNSYVPRLFFAGLACYWGIGQAEQYGSIYFLGYTKHMQPKPQTREGNIDYIGISKELHYGKFQFDTGVNTYVDSYSKRSYSIFTNVSHSDYRYGYITPVLGLACSYKGVGYDTDAMGVICFPMPKVEIGKKSGLFALVTVIPPFGDLTNGLVGLELGYKW
jgi:hypothetical protein